MEFNVKAAHSNTVKTDCLILPIADSESPKGQAAIVDKASRGYLTKLIKQCDITGTSGQTLLLQQVEGIKAKRVLIVGTGKTTEMNERTFIKVAQTVAGALSGSAAKDAMSCLDDIDVPGRDSAWKAKQATIMLGNSQYHFDTSIGKKPKTKPALTKVTMLITDKANLAAARKSVKHGSAISGGMSRTRELGNLPANYCTPTHLAKEAIQMGKGQPKLKVSVLDEAAMRKLKMGSLLSVSAGSRQPAKLITFEYRGGKEKDKPIVLVGKGVTFDTGGVSLKPGASMDEMKFDMCGAASVFGTIDAVNQMQLPINVVGIVPATENMPDGIATKPGDVVTSMSGQTIEVLNTDAEGRLILCDALTYAKKFNPSCVIDIATLTGAVIIALGKVPSGVMGNNQPLIDELVDAGKTSEDKIWQLPIWDEYQDQLKSNFADIANIGGRDAGSITAACFLSRFTKNYKWAHLDIAGTAWHSGDKKGATGRPVPLLTEFILSRL